MSEKIIPPVYIHIQVGKSKVIHLARRYEYFLRPLCGAASGENCLHVAGAKLTCKRCRARIAKVPASLRIVEAEDETGGEISYEHR